LLSQGWDMSKSSIQTDRSGPKAAPRFEVVAGAGRGAVAGKRIHFIGAGGVGMSGLAKLLLKDHALVTGSDQAASAVTENLNRLGANITIGHRAENLDPQTDAVVVSAAIREDNPELVSARKRGCRIYKYAQMLGELMNGHEGIAVAGTHGKSTTTAWLAYCLKRAGIDASFIVGADVPQLGGSSGVGESPHFVVEACEYDRSFLNLKPRLACILNIEADHLDYYRDEDEIVDAFCEFAGGIRDGGVLIANGQDRNVARVIHTVRPAVRCETFGFDRDCSFCADGLRATDGLYSFSVHHQGRLLGRTKIPLPGRHNVLNALAVIAAAANVGLDPHQVLELLGDFAGIDRRLMLKERIGRITILDDYAHHPTEIRASLLAIRQRYRPRRLWCVFQPHQYSRTRFLLDDFTESFKFADVTIVPEIYFVRDSDSAKKDVNSQMLVERIRATGAEAMFIPDFGGICEYLSRNVAPGDLVVTMGAGDIWKVADEYIQRLGTDS